MTNIVKKGGTVLPVGVTVRSIDVWSCVLELTALYSKLSTIG